MPGTTTCVTMKYQLTITALALGLAMSAQTIDVVNYNDEGHIYETGQVDLDGNKVGVWFRFYDNGELRSQVTYVDDTPQGEYRLFAEDGTMYELGWWEYGVNVGTLFRYWPNGQPQQVLQFDDFGVGIGKQCYYHDNGQLEMVVTLVDGVEHGDIIRLDRSGRIISRVTYHYGRIVKRQ